MFKYPCNRGGFATWPYSEEELGADGELRCFDNYMFWQKGFYEKKNVNSDMFVNVVK
jgi:hypothetical protein